jgi:hypothetical protein
MSSSHHSAANCVLVLGTYLQFGQRTWFVIRGTLGPSAELTLALPSSSMLSNDQPPPGLLHGLDEERQKRGLIFEKLALGSIEGMSSCKYPPPLRVEISAWW